MVLDTKTDWPTVGRNITFILKLVSCDMVGHQPVSTWAQKQQSPLLGAIMKQWLVKI
jgi:hypothetical protein